MLTTEGAALSTAGEKEAVETFFLPRNCKGSSLELGFREVPRSGNIISMKTATLKPTSDDIAKLDNVVLRIKKTVS